MKGNYENQLEKKAAEFRSREAVTEKTVPAVQTAREEEEPAPAQHEVKQRKKKAKTKPIMMSIYVSEEVKQMVETAARAYGGNASMYIRNAIIRDYEKNKEMYESLPDIYV